MEMDSKTAAQIAADQLRALILEGRFRRGEPLRQDRLAEALGISRTPLRQALQILSEDGLVQMTGFKGARVIDVTADLVADLFEMRLALEPMALRSSFGRLSKLDLAAAEMALDAADGETTPARLSDLNWSFHSALYAPSGRTMLLETIRRLNRSSALAEVVASSIAARRARSHAEHLELLEICRGRDAEAAAACLTRHLSRAYAAVKPVFEA